MNLPSYPTLAALHTALHEPPVFAWLELDRNGTVLDGTQLFPRNWAKNGFAQRTLPGGSVELADSSTLAMWGQKLSESAAVACAAIVIQSPENAAAAAQLLTSLALEESLSMGCVLVLVRENDHLLCDGVALQKRDLIDATNHVRLELKGARTQVYHNTYLPKQLSLRLGYSPTSRTLLHVHASAPAKAGCKIPQARWFRASLPDSTPRTNVCALSVDIEPHVDPEEDRWVLSFTNGSQGRWTEALAPESHESAPAKPLHLYVIYDRTCPDAQLWPLARALISGAPSAPQKNTVDSTARSPGTAPLSQPNIPTGDLNRSLRESTGAALRDALASIAPSFPSITVYPFWVGDVASEAFDPIGGGPATTIATGAHTPQRADSPSMATLFHNEEYIPGLDVFDPLEHALAAVNTRCQQRGGDEPSAVIIIGNSPPTFDATDSTKPGALEETKAYELFTTAAGGIRFNPRPRGRPWHEALSIAEQNNTLVIYALLHLQHEDSGGEAAPTLAAMFPRNSDYSRVRDRLRAVEDCTRRALELFPSLHLTASQPATPSGITAALREAATLLATELNGHSASTATPLPR